MGKEREFTEPTSRCVTAYWSTGINGIAGSMMEDKRLDGYVMWLEPRQSFAGGSKPSIYCVGRNMCLIFLFLSMSNTVSHAFVPESKTEGCITNNRGRVQSLLYSQLHHVVLFRANRVSSNVSSVLFDPST